MDKERTELTGNIVALLAIAAILSAIFPHSSTAGQRLTIYENDGSLDRIQKFSATGTIISKWGSEGAGDGQFLHIHGIAVDSHGNVYATDERRSDIQKFDSNGNFITKWGTKGSGEGEFSSRIEDIALNPNGNLLYVVDYGQHSIKKFTADGTFIMKWGSKGTGDGQFDRPWGVAVDSFGNVFVSDRNNCHIQKFTADGTFIMKWGTCGLDSGQFGWPLGIAVDASDNTVFVADETNNRIQKFDNNGAFITKWGTKGRGEGQFSGPHGIAINGLNREVNVVDSKNQRIQRFTSDGGYISEFGTKGIGVGQFLMPHDIALDTFGNYYVSDQKFQHPELDAVKSFISNNEDNSTYPSDTVYPLQDEYYTLAVKWGSRGIGNGQFERPHDIELDAQGNIYVSDRDRNDIQVFSPSNAFLYKFGSEGTSAGEFSVPYSISIDKEWNFLYVVDRDNNRVQKFLLDGTFVEKFDAPVGNPGKAFKVPEDMAIDPASGFMYLADTGNNRIIKVDRSFNFVMEWGSEGDGPGQFVHPHGIGVDSRGNVYVNDLESPRIQKFDGDGNFIMQWGSFGIGDGQFSPPLEHLAVDPFDHVWMVDGEGNPRILKFDNNGTFLGSVGTGPCIIEEEVKQNPHEMEKPLQCDGRLHKPEHVTIDSLGNLYVVDRGNQRIEVFSLSDTPHPSGKSCLYESSSSRPCLNIQTVASGLRFPTGMAFLSENDILVIEKNAGTVRRIVNGYLQEQPLLKVNVATASNEQGMLGIAATKISVDGTGDSSTIYVFLYYTEAGADGVTPVGNRLYRYKLVDNMLVDPQLFFSLPAGLAHNGGPITIGPDNNVYLVVGNLFSERLNGRPWDKLGDTLAQNVEGAAQPDGRGGILRFTLDGGTVDGKGIIGDDDPLDKYYAYGIRNSFGIAFDPLTGGLWDTENGPDFGDEINLVEPGFNSGSNAIHGVAPKDYNSLVDFEGRGKYSDPELTWNHTVAPTAIAFLDSNVLGEEYRNDIFVGSAIGLLFHFDLNGDRTGLLLDDSLSDKVSNHVSDVREAIFGSDFGIITDIEVGPDGYMYVVSVIDDGKILRIGPAAAPQETSSQAEINSFVRDLGRIQKFSSDGTFITKWGSKGTGDGQFLHTHGIAVDPDGNVYATDEERALVQKFSSDGTFITKWGSKGTGDGQFSSKIEDITASSDGNVYVVDYGLNRIQKFDNNGTFITKWGSKGTGDGQFDRPWGVAVDSFGNVYVTDQRNNRIQKFTSDGTFITKWGSEGLGDGQFVHLHAIAIDKHNNIYVSDARENGLIQKFTSEGTFITKWGAPGTGDGQFKEHHGIALDSLDNVYVADTANQRIQKFTSEGTFMTKWDLSTGYQFVMPQDIAIDRNDRLFISDVADAHPEISYVNKFLQSHGIEFPKMPSFVEHAESKALMTYIDNAPVEIAADTGATLVSVTWSQQEQSANGYSIRVEFLDLFTHGRLDGDVIYSIRVIDSGGEIFYSKQGIIARHSTDMQTVELPRKESYSFEVEVEGLIREGQPIDQTRNGIATGIVVVPEFSPGILGLIMAGFLSATVVILRSKVSHVRSKILD